MLYEIYMLCENFVFGFMDIYILRRLLDKNYINNCIV